MKFVHKTLGLLLASLALSSCGGGGGNGGGVRAAAERPHHADAGRQLDGAAAERRRSDVHGRRRRRTRTKWTFTGRTRTARPCSGHDLSCSITNLAVISIHILDDASTPQDESAIDWGNVQVHSDTGHAICWVFSTGQAGTATLNVGGVDPVTGAHDFSLAQLHRAERLGSHSRHR